MAFTVSIFGNFNMESLGIIYCIEYECLSPIILVKYSTLTIFNYKWRACWGFCIFGRHRKVFCNAKLHISIIFYGISCCERCWRKYVGKINVYLFLQIIGASVEKSLRQNITLTCWVGDKSGINPQCASAVVPLKGWLFPSLYRYEVEWELKRTISCS